MRFEQLDKDNNGYLDRQELGSAIAMMADDRDGDGKVYLQEMQAAAAEARKRASAQMVLVASEMGGTLFELVDANGDQHLSRRELNNLPNRTREVEASTDESLIRESIPKRFELVLRPGQRLTGTWTFTANVVGLMPGDDQPRSKDGPNWFIRMDRNHDGDVSRREFLGPRKRFEAMDQDHDELIDATEASLAEDAVSATKIP